MQNINSVTTDWFDDKYLLEKQIGKGGMGEVYKARHRYMGNIVAVKILNPALVSDEVIVERFRREACAAGQIDHPNVIKMLDFGVTKDNRAYLVMEFIEGLTLREKREQIEQFTYQEISVILNQVASGLHAAHCRGIIHRDLKPDNILIAGSEDIRNEGIRNKVKILDFGIAKLVNEKTITAAGMALGTPHYMAPEQCYGQDIDHRCDIYSLGVMLYELLSGRRPFIASTPVAILCMHVNKQPIHLREVCNSIPEKVAAVVMQALEKNPDHRPGSAQILAKQFEIAIEETGIEETPVEAGGEQINNCTLYSEDSAA